MKIFLEKAIFINRAPFKELKLDFSENEIAVLSAVNGRGKTTILSHIVDAFYEMAKLHFLQEFEGDKQDKFYRLSTSLYNLDSAQPSFVYMRFKTSTGDVVDYVDIRGDCTKEQYDQAIQIEGKIPFSDIAQSLENKFVKKTSTAFSPDKVKEIFKNNILTYFPSYRFEMPGYLNDPYKIKMDFRKNNDFAGKLKNRLEVVSGLQELANWLMDVVLDLRINIQPDTTLLKNMNSIISQTLVSKKFGDIGFGIGIRVLGGARIQIIKEEGGKTVYPSIFNLSSGESSILCLFGELLRQADNSKINISLEEITGIVLIDEVDKHLHIKLQKEVLPKLFKLFPNVQFIVSSHSPFLSMGLAEELPDRSQMVDLDNDGIKKRPIQSELYQEVYEMMISENDRFRDDLLSLKEEVKKGTNTLIITEGKTDIQHIKKAKEILKISDSDCDIQFSNLSINEKGWGYKNLDKALKMFAKDKQLRKIIGIFDRDESSIVKDVEKGGQPFKHYDNNVFAFCIPKPGDRDFDEVSIEHYYSDENIKKENSEGRRLFLGSEFYKTGNSKLDQHQTKIRDKSDKNTIIDTGVYCENDRKWRDSIALSKSDFANLIENDKEFIKDFSFENFHLIFDKIKQIINPKT